MDAKQESPMGEPLDAIEWARTVEPGRRLSLGEIEAEVMRRRLPPKRRLTRGDRVAQVIGFVLLSAIGLAVVAAPLVGMGVVLVHVVGADPLASEGLLSLGRIAFVVTATLPMAILAMWWNARDRYRRWWDLPAVALIAVIAGASIAAVVSRGEAFPAGFLLWMVAAVVTGVGTFIGILVASRPGRAPKRVKRDPADERFEQVRSSALSILANRKLADIEDRDITVHLIDMPRGGWIERDRQRGRG